MSEHEQNEQEAAFPVDWNEWQAEWQAWRDAHASDLRRRSTFAWPQKNFLADDIIGRWHISGREVELSEVTMPDFSRGYGADRVRFVGVTYGEPDGSTTAGPVVSSFAELEQELGLS